mmetsp:Transcript_26105/g.84505  ORF Transcript_26105/g.84505 Transcript_26105/m.84505 type:complete len:219 (+) Transcript_26105:1130-1786(+)
MLLISSMITTVFPTPAPPKRPIFPPLAYGASKSTTLIPVDSTSCDFPCSTKVGGLRWIGAWAFAPMGPFSSMGSPMTLTIRPRHSGPTSIEIGAPVSSISWPRTNPSVASMAIVRTVFSPKCCATSSTSRPCSVCVSRAFMIGGNASGNCTSTTAPITDTTLPAENSRTPCRVTVRATRCSILPPCLSANWRKTTTFKSRATTPFVLDSAVDTQAFCA